MLDHRDCSVGIELMDVAGDLASFETPCCSLRLEVQAEDEVLVESEFRSAACQPFLVSGLVFRESNGLRPRVIAAGRAPRAQPIAGEIFDRDHNQIVDTRHLQCDRFGSPRFE